MRDAWALILIVVAAPQSSAFKKMLPFFLGSDTCWNNACNENFQNDSVNNLLSSLNTSVDPCDDFYEFACGGWIAKKFRPRSAPSWSQWEPVTQKVEERIKNILEENKNSSQIKSMKLAKKMYQSCINFGNFEAENVIALVNLLNVFGGWPIMNKTWTGKDSWDILVAKINSVLKIHPLLKYHVSRNLYNTSQYILYVDMPSFAFPHWILSNPLAYEGHLQIYKEWIINVTREIGRISKLNFSSKEIERQAFEIVDFEMQVANLFTSKAKSNATSLYKMIQIKHLQLRTDLVSKTDKNKINWKTILKILFGGENITVTPEDYIIVKDFSYLLKLHKLIQNTSPHIVSNYIEWIIVKYFSKDVTSNMENFSFVVDKILLGVGENISRQNYCVISVKKQMSLAVNYEYVKRYLDKNARNDVKLMVEALKSVLISKIKSLHWLDDETKRNALDKAQAISYLVAYPDYLKNSTYIDSYYNEFKISENYVGNIILWNKFTRKREFQKLRRNTQNEKWFTRITDVNAFYSVLHNSVIIPAGLLQQPFYSSKRHSAMNYGAIGTIIGHEISHAFDNTGRQADKHGNFKQWWSSESLHKYKRKLKCFEEHYEKFFIKLIHGDLNSSLKIPISQQKSQDENIADIIGLILAQEAYNHSKRRESKPKFSRHEKKFTDDQFFFISFATQWCEETTPEQMLMQIFESEHYPSKIRVLGLVSSSPEFSRAFKCRPNSPMNPATKCKVLQ